MKTPKYNKNHQNSINTLDKTEIGSNKKLSLIEENEILINRIRVIKNQIRNLENDIDHIKSGKYFKLWQKYTSFKKIFIKN